MISLFVLLIFLSALLSIVYYSVKLGISPQPSTPATKKIILSLLPAEVKGSIYELGSGWGGLAILLARHYPEKTIHAFEKSIVPYVYSLFLKKILGIQNLNLFNRDFLTAEFLPNSLVVVYLMPKGMKALSLILDNSQTIISNTFILPGRVYDKKITLSDLYNTPVYLYKEK